MKGGYAMRNNFLRSKMALHDETAEDLANVVGVTVQTLSRKINGDGDFTQTEMNIIKNHYDLSDSEFAEMFTKDV